MPDSIHIIGSKGSGGAERFCARLVNSLGEQSRVLAINPLGNATKWSVAIQNSDKVIQTNLWRSILSQFAQKQMLDKTIAIHQKLSIKTQ